MDEKKESKMIKYNQVDTKKTKTIKYSQDDMKKVLSDNINFYLSRKGITQTIMAKDLNFPESTVSNWMKGETYPRPDRLQAMADYFNVRRSDLTEDKPKNMVGTSSSVRIPILGEIACGNPILADENITGYRNEHENNLPNGELYYVKAKGNSMEPTIPNGSFVLIREQPEVEYGQIAAVLVNDDSEVTLKRIKKQGDLTMLVPDNPNHEPMIITKENPAKILGRAMRFSQDL